MAKAPESPELAWSGAKSYREALKTVFTRGLVKYLSVGKMAEIRQSVPSRRQQETPGSRPPRTTPSQIRSLHSGNKQKWPLLYSRHLKKFTDLDTAVLGRA